MPIAPIKPITKDMLNSFTHRCLASLQKYFLYLRNLVQKALLLITRSIYLAAMFSPSLATSPSLILGNASVRKTWWAYLRYAVRSSGPCCTKLCQWAATRPDLFPEEVVRELSLLQADAYQHSQQETESALTAAFGKNWKSMLELNFDDKVLGNGCIASVYEGRVGDTKGTLPICVCTFLLFNHI
jgi:aarF domain-containing kinase